MAFRITFQQIDIEIDNDRSCLWIYMSQSTVKVALESVSVEQVSSAFRRIIGNRDTFVSHCSLYCGGHVEVCKRHGYQDPEDGPGCPDCRRESYDASLQDVRLAEMVWQEVRGDLMSFLQEELKINLSQQWLDEHGF